MRYTTLPLALLLLGLAGQDRVQTPPPGSAATAKRGQFALVRVTVTDAADPLRDLVRAVTPKL